MKRLTFYPSVWPVPYSLNEASNFFQNGELVKELILSTSSNVSSEVSEMNLNINKFSAIDENGQEHVILNFSQQNSITFKGISSGHFLKSASLSSLNQGTYTTLRFYLNKENNCFIKSSGDMVAVNNLEFLDFEIENGLTVNGQGSVAFKLWFDFAPYKLSKYFKPFTDLFKAEEMLVKDWPKVVYNYLQ